MATYSEADFDSKHYDSARPSYPDQFYETLVKYHNRDGNKNANELAIDIGCGSGFVTFKLEKFFSKVIGTDVSETMVNHCQNDPRTKASNKLEFLQGSAEAQPSQIKESSVDLITGAECCHWVDHPKFFRESYRVLKPGGTLAYWFYGDPVFIGYPKANEIYMKFTYGSSKKLDPSEPFERFVGPYYEQPGHNYLRTLLKEIQVPSDLFKDIIRNEYRPDVNKSDCSKTTLFISKKATLRTFLLYVKSWSAYHTWMKEHGNKYDVAEAFIDELKQKLDWTLDTEFELCFPTVYTFAKKK